MREVIELDLSKLDLRGAISGTIALGIAVVFIGIFGDVGLAAGIAALFVIAGAKGRNQAPDAISVLLILVGAVITLLVGFSDGTSWGAAIAIAAITLLATLTPLWGPRLAAAGVFAVLWAVLVLVLGGTSENAFSLALAFLVGGGLALVVLWVSSRVPSKKPANGVSGPDDHEGPDPDAETGAATGPDSGKSGQVATKPRAAAVNRSSVITFAVMRALLAGICVYVGYTLFPDHPAWMILTFVLVVRPPASQAITIGLGRALGTVLGVLLGMGVAQLAAGNTPAQIVAFVVFGFCMVATQKVNYAVFNLFTTSFMLISFELLQEGVVASGWQRLFATLLGIVLAFALIAIARLLVPPPSAIKTKTPEEAGDDTNPISGRSGQ